MLALDVFARGTTYPGAPSLCNVILCLTELSVFFAASKSAAWTGFTVASVDTCSQSHDSSLFEVRHAVMHGSRPTDFSVASHADTSI